MEKFTINGNVIKAKEMDFNFLCDLQENGIGIEEIDRKYLSAVRVYVAFCMGTSVELAGEMFNEHIINGGTMDEVTKAFSEKAESSDFFQALGKNAKEQETTTKKNAKKKDEEVTE